METLLFCMSALLDQKKLNKEQNTEAEIHRKSRSDNVSQPLKWIYRLASILKTNQHFTDEFLSQQTISIYE